MTSNEIDDPFAQAVDEDDPFATSDDVKSSGFAPSPTLVDLEGRLLALVPRAFTDSAPKPEEFQKNDTDTTQDRYTVDLVVLDGGPLTFEYQGPKDQNGQATKMTHAVTKFPALFSGKWIFEMAVIGQLKKVDGTARPILSGRLVRGPQAKDRRAGKTIKDISEAFEVWRKNPRGNAPRFSWQIDVDGVTDADRGMARAWYAGAKAEGFAL